MKLAHLDALTSALAELECPSPESVATALEDAASEVGESRLRELQALYLLLAAAAGAVRRIDGVRHAPQA